MFKKWFLGPFALSVRRSVSKDERIEGYGLGGPILRYIFASQKHSGRTVPVLVLWVVLLFIYPSQLVAYQRHNTRVSHANDALPKEASTQKKAPVYHTPSELIQGHNFWIGCEVVDAMQDMFQDERSVQVKKLFSIPNNTDESIMTSIPNGIDFILFHNAMVSEQELCAWYAKIRPGGMLIGIGDDSALQDTINKTFINQNALIQQVNPHLWYVQKKHFLSCIIPAYNRAHTLSAAIDSLYKQDLKIPFEVIVTDDASTDATQKLLQDYQRKYANFSFYVHAVNGGASKARNTCVEHAQGDLIFNLDSDNYLEPRSLQGLIDLLDTTGSDIAVFGMIKYFSPTPEGYKILSHLWRFKFPNNICSFHTIFGNTCLPIGSGNYLFTKKSFERVKGYNGRTAETWRFGYKQLATGSKIAVLPNSYYWHRLSPDGKWNSNEALEKNNPAIFKVCMQYPELLVPNKSLFTSDTMNLLSSIEKGKIKSIAADALEHLFTAYRYEEFGLFDDAVKEYDGAIQKGAQHENVYSRRAFAYQMT